MDAQLARRRDSKTPRRRVERATGARSTPAARATPEIGLSGRHPACPETSCGHGRRRLHERGRACPVWSHQGATDLPPLAGGLNLALRPNVSVSLGVPRAQETELRPATDR